MPDDHIGSREVAVDDICSMHLGEFRPNQLHDFIYVRRVEGGGSEVDIRNTLIVTRYSSRGST